MIVLTFLKLSDQIEEKEAEELSECLSNAIQIRNIAQSARVDSKSDHVLVYSSQEADSENARERARKRHSAYAEIDRQ